MNNILNNCDSHEASSTCSGKYYCFCALCEDGTRLLLEQRTGINFRSSLHGRHCWITLKHTWSIREALAQEALPVKIRDEEWKTDYEVRYPLSIDWDYKFLSDMIPPL